MKKVLLSIFCLIFGFNQTCIAAITLNALNIPDATINNLGYMDKGNCKLRYDIATDNDDWVLVPGRNRWDSDYTQGYKTDGGACTDIGHTDYVCIAGQSTYNGTKYLNSCFKADRGWAGSWLPGNDNWKNNGNIPDCSTNQNTWTKAGPNKIAVFVNKTDSIITDTKKIPLRSVQGDNVINQYNIKCVAYVCIDDNNRITYGDKNGECNNSLQDSAPHMNTTTQYLNALQNTCSTIK